MKAIENFTTLSRKENKTGRDLPFEIYSLQILDSNSNNFFIGQHNDHSFKIIWITRGTGACNIDLQKSAVENNQLFFIKPGQFHELILDEPFEGYGISFSESFLSMEEQEGNSTYHTSLFKLFATANAISIQNDLSDMKNIAEKMIQEFDGHNLFRAEILRRYFKILLIYITRQFEGNIYVTRQTRNMEIVQQFMNLLEKNYKEKKLVSDYASRLFVTPNYLNEIIKKTTGFSAGHHIRQRIVLEAKRQATYSGSCMKEIAYCLGFGDMAHFSKFFKNTTGVNFTEFKKEMFIISAYSNIA